MNVVRPVTLSANASSYKATPYQGMHYTFSNNKLQNQTNQPPQFAGIPSWISTPLTVVGSIAGALALGHFGSPQPVEPDRQPAPVIAPAKLIGTDCADNGQVRPVPVGAAASQPVELLCGGRTG